MASWQQGGDIPPKAMIIYGGEEYQPIVLGRILPWPITYRLRSTHWWKFAEAQARAEFLPIYELRLKVNRQGLYIVELVKEAS
jgi:hypothetical protein